MKVSIAISALNQNNFTQAKALAERLNLPLVPPDNNDYFCLLIFTPTRLELRLTTEKAPGPVYAEFLNGVLRHRRLFGGGRGQLIARAIGLKSNPHPRVLDLTAGLGRDAFVLATLGCDVTMLERNPIIIALLKDGLKRAAAADWFKSLQLQLITTDAKQYLLQIEKYPDVIYLDPMYPLGKKTALVKKEMRILRHIVGADEDCQQLLPLALQKARQRVVVKRARHAPTIAGSELDNIYKGKSSRFDVYLIS